MRDAFKYLTSLLFLAVVVQVGFAGYGAFNAIDKADENQTITKKTIENGFDPHGIMGTIVLVIMLLLLVVALVGRLERMIIRLSAVIFVLGLLQILFAYLGTKSAPLGFLHGINALAIYGAVAFLAHRAWAQRPAAAV
jgi:Family of unknown function (DUF6220)